MRKISPLSILLITAFTIAAQHAEAQDAPPTLSEGTIRLSSQQKYRLHYDKFKDETTIVSELASILNTKGKKDIFGPSVYVAVTFPGKRPKGNAVFWLIFSDQGREWRYLKSHGLLLLADGKKIDLGNGKHDGDVSSGRYAGVSVSERIMFQIPIEDVRTVIGAKVVDFQLGTTEGSLHGKTIEAFRDLMTIEK